jgi:hypothetical protein
MADAGMFWKREQRDPIEGCADALYTAVKGAVTQGGRVRVEDLISAAAAIVGEAAIAKTGEFDPRRHDFPPGARIFSPKINALICDDKSLQEFATSVRYSRLRDSIQCVGRGRQRLRLVHQSLDRCSRWASRVPDRGVSVPACQR